MLSLVVQVIGSLAVLAGFALSQWNLLDAKSVPYLVINAVGSGLLAVDAVVEQQWGFLLLEGVWSLVSLISLARWAWDRLRPGLESGGRLGAGRFDGGDGA